MARPKADSWVAAVEKHAKEGLVLIVAYLGGSAEEGWKLYTNAELSEYIEVADRDIVDSVQLKAEHFPLGGSLVWVKRDATLRHTRITSRSVQASFLQGNDFASQGIGASAVDMSPMGACSHSWNPGLCIPGK